MFRRAFLLGLVAALFGAGGSLAQGYADTLLSELRRDGYGDFVLSRTLLGRLRIVAERNGRRREIILNPNTGEILRDLLLVEERGDRDSPSGGRSSGRSGESGGRNDDGDDDRSDSDDDGGEDDHGGSDGGGRDDDRDDSSGRGSGGGGSGGGSDDRDDDSGGGHGGGDRDD